MFKKADKNELKTWFLGSVVMTLLCSVISIALLVDIFGNGFKIGTMIFAVIALLFSYIFCKYAINSMKAYKTYDERKSIENEEKALKDEMDAKALEEKIRLEKEEMEAIRVKEEERAKNNALELERMKKEQMVKENEKKN